MLTSIVIVTHNGADAVRRCLDSIRQQTEDVPYELIIVDNASVDGTPTYLSTLTDAQVVLNDENRGFAAGCNQGLQLAKGDYLLLLNPDTVVTEGWLKRLIAHAERDHEVGAVGPVSNGTGELQLDLLAEAQFEDIEQMQDYARRVAKKNRGKAWDFHRLAGFCILVKREVFERVGELDEQFGIGYFEDDDYCKRIRNAGYRLLIARDVFIHHEGGVSFSSLTSGSANQLLLTNRVRYVTKWSGANWFTTIPATDLPRPAVSVLIATRGRPNLLRFAVASVLEQTFDNFEVLVVNDGELNDLDGIQEELSDDRIRILHSGQKGKPRALNLALENARGQFIAYLDDDDLYYPWHLETLVAALLNRPSYKLVYTDTVVGYCFPSKDGHRVSASHPFKKMDYDRALLRDEDFIPHLSMLHHRSLIEQAGAYYEGLPIYEDWEALRRFSSFTDFLHVPMITCEWHFHLTEVSLNNPPLGGMKVKQDAATFMQSRLLPDMGEPTVYDLVLTARNTEALGRFQMAANVYLAALKTDPLSYEANLGAARTLRRLREPKRTRALLRQAVASRPDLPGGYIAYAEELLRSRPSKDDIRAAKEALEFALVVDPADEIRNVYRMLGRCYGSLGFRSTARACRDHSRRFRRSGIFEQARRFIGVWRKEGLEVAMMRTLRAFAPQFWRVFVRLRARTQ
ncbi:MAG TPA: glycosyltransferase [Dehalococcoidia bacterium]